MRYIPWNPALETGNAEVDEQHRALYALVNDLNAAALVDIDDTQIAHQLARILRYAVTHFATEQALMEESGYPRAEAHMAIHNDFADAAEELARAYGSGTGTSAVELAIFMQDWLETHIREEDRPLVEYLRAWTGETEKA